MSPVIAQLVAQRQLPGWSPGKRGEELRVRLGGGTGVDRWLRWVLEPPEPWNCRGERGREEDKGDRRISLKFS